MNPSPSLHQSIRLSACRRVAALLLFAMLACAPAWASPSTTDKPDAPDVIRLSKGVTTLDALTGQHYELIGDSQLILQHTKAPIRAGQIDLNADDATVIFQHARPSQVNEHYLKHIRIKGQPAALNQNVRLAPYVNGTILLPHGPDYQPLTTYNQPKHQGAARTYALHQYYKSNGLGEDEDKIASFTLKHGYMATLAENEDGTGASHVFIADQQDLRINQLPSKLRNKVSFIRVFPWRWTAKKGYGGKPDQANQLDVPWRYNWGAGDESTLDMEYVLMKHNANWPSWDQINNKQNVTHLLGFNEPMQKDQADMTLQQVLNLWPKLQASGLRLGSPCTTDGTVDWLYEFLDKAKALGYRVDFITVHYYKGGWSDEKFIGWMREIHERTGLPLWVTEFNNGARWVKGHNPTLEQNAEVIEGYCKIMDRCEFIERYAIFNMQGNRAIFADGQLTPAGIRYRDHASSQAYRSKP